MFWGFVYGEKVDQEKIEQDQGAVCKTGRSYFCLQDGFCSSVQH